MDASFVQYGSGGLLALLILRELPNVYNAVKGRNGQGGVAPQDSPRSHTEKLDAITRLEESQLVVLKEIKAAIIRGNGGKVGE